MKLKRKYRSCMGSSGAFEIPLVAKKMAESGKYDAVITLGAVIKGSTPHLDYMFRSIKKV